LNDVVDLCVANYFGIVYQLVGVQCWYCAIIYADIIDCSIIDGCVIDCPWKRSLETIVEIDKTIGLDEVVETSE